MRRFREAHGTEDWEQARADLEKWGYPRPLEDDELERGCVLRWGHDVIAWLVDDETPGLLCLHMCFAPEARNKIFARRLLTGVEVVAELLGADRIAADLDSNDPVFGYCKRLGWKEDADLEAIVRDLGGT